MSVEIEWRTIAPLWTTTLETPQAILRPALLRFSSDNFMDEFLARVQPANRTMLLQHLPATENLKLFQPIHGDFNLVAASLVCRTVGLPDRTINAATERIGFVLRRLRDESETDPVEYAWVTDANQAHVWQSQSQPRTLAPNEEIFPLFPISYVEGDRKRRIYAGLIPTASRDTFVATGALNTLAPDATFHPLEDLIENQIVAQLQALKEHGEQTSLGQARDASIFLLLDLALFLETNLKDIWAVIEKVEQPPAYLNGQLEKFVEGKTSLHSALRQVYAQRRRITGDELPAPTLTFDLRETEIDPRTLGNALRDAINAAKVNVYNPPINEPLPKLDPAGTTRYVLRCVYRRDCVPPRPPTVSEPSIPFALAGFFDPDAPARTLRIEMPVDTTPGGLRKFKKNVGFLLSDHLRKQLERVTDAKAALDGDLGDEQAFDLGALCSFSIPIITICALIVLMIFINLLNIIFWWLPLLRICFPLNLKAKGG
jgi:hypothetical protein